MFLQTQSFEASNCHDGRFKFPFFHFSESRVYISAKIPDPQVRPICAELGGASQRTGSYHRIFRQRVQIDSLLSDQSVVSNFSGWEGRNFQLLRQNSRHVFHAMDRQIDLMPDYGAFQFFNKQPLAAEFCKRMIEDTISFSFNYDQLDSLSRIAKQDLVTHPICLPERQSTSSRTDTQCLQHGLYLLKRTGFRTAKEFECRRVCRFFRREGGRLQFEQVNQRFQIKAPVFAIVEIAEIVGGFVQDFIDQRINHLLHLPLLFGRKTAQLLQGFFQFGNTPFRERISAVRG